MMKKSLMTALFVLFFLIAAALLAQYWNILLSWIVEAQQYFHQLLSNHIREVADSSRKHALFLLGVSFLYGLFHAAGPGHGKAVLVTYLTTQKESIRQGVFISFLAAIIQSFVAIALIGLLALVLETQFSETNKINQQVELSSYVLVMLIGAYLVVRSGLPLIKRRLSQAHVVSHQHDHSHHHHHHHHDHNHDHPPHHVYAPTEALSLWQSWLVALSMGLRPCSGAIVVLIYANLVNVFYIGVISVLVMGLGTGIMVMTLAVVSVWFRETLSRWFHGATVSHSHGGTIAQVVGAVGGAVLVWLGWSLFQLTNETMQSHPLF